MTVGALDAHRRLSHGEQLARRARIHPNRLALAFEDEERTYGELDARVVRLANALTARGVAPGDRVAVLANNGLEVVEAFLACGRMGAVCVPLNFRLVAAELETLVRDCAAAALVVGAEHASVAAAVRTAVGGDAPCLVIGALDGAAGPGSEGYEAALAAASTQSPDVDVGEHDLAFIMYTSGTTGRPKGAMLTHFNLLVNTFNMVAIMGIGPDEVFLTGLPLFHVGGMNMIGPQLLLGGATVLLRTGEFDPANAVDVLERRRCTGCYFVPTQWQEICAQPGVGDRELRLRRMMWGASVAPPSVLSAMAETFGEVPTYNLFGQTEMSSITCVLTGEDAVRKSGSIGRPIFAIEARVVDDDLRDVADGDVGEIVYRGPTVMQGYWDDPEATAEAFHGGWFHSGDLVRADEEGYLWVADRKKDMIISGGENIFSPDVEAVIDAHPGVLEVAVVGIPHERWVETPIAVLAPADPAAPPTTDEIQDWCRTRLASFKKPTQVHVVDRLPRTASGKVLKHVLRERFGA